VEHPQAGRSARQPAPGRTRSCTTDAHHNGGNRYAIDEGDD